ncbi:MAG: glycosyltransferase family 2 protein [Planctomycetes bacterium]|nr:glycosyltransferase family 2 protein [Planctomycetota bacterium]
MDAPLVSIVVVSYRTKDLTLTALRTVFDQTEAGTFELLVVDNASDDGSADAIAEEFGDRLTLIRSEENLGFAWANNLAAERARGEYLLLLNPDTEVLDRAIDRLLEFARTRPQAGIWGGRTLFKDRSLNPASCWQRITPWSTVCMATGLRAVFKESNLFNPEGIGGWRRDSEREVDIVVGCFLLTRLETWRALGGFDLRYFMYGEEADLCLRARALGCRPAITPEAEIIHLVGASSPDDTRKEALITKARVTLVRTHWPAWQVPFGLSMFWTWALLKAVAARLRGRPQPHGSLFSMRKDWLAGYPPLA